MIRQPNRAGCAGGHHLGQAEPMASVSHQPILPAEPTGCFPGEGGVTQGWPAHRKAVVLGRQLRHQLLHQQRRQASNLVAVKHGHGARGAVRLEEHHAVRVAVHAGAPARCQRGAAGLRGSPAPRACFESCSSASDTAPHSPLLLASPLPGPALSVAASPPPVVVRSHLRWQDALGVHVVRAAAAVEDARAGVSHVKGQTRACGVNGSRQSARDKCVTQIQVESRCWRLTVV